MGILRADRVSGLGGANAINGSVFFGNGNMATAYDSLKTEPSSDFIMGTGDFTLEGWFYLGNVTQNWQALIGDTLYGSAGGWTFYVAAATLYFYKGGASVVTGGTVTANTWHHLAFSRASGSNKLFIDGAVAATASDSTNYTHNVLSIGANNVDKGTIGANGFDGYASNVRVTKGTALYTAAFTPPTTRLEKRSDTVLLCCQSPGNAEQEATGKIIDARGKAAASHFAPDVGEDHGTTFADNTKFDTLSYMVPPGGTTAESNRGRGLFSGGDANPAVKDDISYLQIQSQGNAADFGNLTARRFGIGGAASSIRGVFAGGYWPNNKNIIDYVTIATTSNATDFGDSTAKRHELAASSNNIRAIFAGGYTPSHIVTIDYITIATTGNATDFGDNNWGKRNMTGAQSPTRGFMIGGRNNTPSPSTAREEIEYVTFSTTGNATDFGNLSQARGRSASVSSSTRAVIIGGETPTAVNTIDYITMATAGNATDFGDSLTVLSNSNNGCSNSTRGAYHVAFISPAKVNNLQYITIASTGNSLDFGDLNYSTTRTTACSDSHGGIS